MNLRTTTHTHTQISDIWRWVWNHLSVSNKELSCTEVIVTLLITNWFKWTWLNFFWSNECICSPHFLTSNDKLQVVATFCTTFTEFHSLLSFLINVLQIFINLFWSDLATILPFKIFNCICLSTLINHWTAFFRCPTMI